MADIILSPIIDLLFEKFVSPTFDKLIRYAGIHSEVKKWEKSLSEIKDLLNDASRKEVNSARIKSWLNSIQHLAYDIEDILDALETEAAHRDQLTEESSGAITRKVRKLIPTCCTSFSVSTRMHDKLSNITTKLQELEKEIVPLGLNVINGRPIVRNRNYETSLPDASDIIGRQGEKEEFLHKLLGEESGNQKFSIVPIVGMGGVGKTTLARLLYNVTQVQNHFKLKAWVCVSDDFNIFNISKSIFQSVTGVKTEFENLNLLQEALTQQLRDRRFLLVLDDVWSESYENWDILVRPFHVGALGSKIIITTRKDPLLKKLGCDNLKHMQKLSYDDALSLFCQHALGVNNFDSHPNLRPHGEGIVNKCDGLPLALKALGRLLKTKKTDEVEWKELLNSDIWKLQEGDEVGPALRLSYHDLDACLKRLFAYCSLFPKDYLFDKEELILLWMAEGFLHHSRESTSTIERLGHNYFEELLSRSFFQQAPNEESLFVMHDMMNDLATSVAGDFFWRSKNEMRLLEKYRHMSFVCEGYISDKKLKAFKGAKNLRTFLALSLGVRSFWKSFYISDKILGDLLHEFPLLRVLSLSHLCISEVPDSIGSLKHLRYLNISHTHITSLPENVCNLYNLQTLIVFGCRRLSKLPNSFSKLKNLRHFDIRETPHVNKMPLGIGELKSLQTLSTIIIGGDDDFPITKLKDLKNFHEMISIEGLDKVQNATHAQEGNLLQMRLKELEVEWSNVFDDSREETFEKEVLDVLKPGNENLKRLTIMSYGGIEFPSWVGDSSFDQLTHVSIRGCKKCTSLPPLGQLPSLKELFIQGMDGVKVVELQRLAFPSLKILSFGDMQGWEVWSFNGGVVDTVFPCLEKLYIRSCPNLVEISLEALPSLRDLEIDGCSDGVLRRLVQVASLVTNLKIVSISGLTDQLWGGVMKHLGAVEEVSIMSCNEIRYMWESETEACKVLVNLRQLQIWYCNKLMRLGEKEEEDDCGSKLTSLRMLRIDNCNSMEHCRCPNSIERLSISHCRSIASITFPTAGQKQLKSVYIVGCVKLLKQDLGGGKSEEIINASMQMLDRVLIDNWSNLKSVIQLSCFNHLIQLEIRDCPSMESFPDHDLPNLSSLKGLEIVNCPSMDASFPQGLWPPNLCYLEIGRLKKPMSEWGPQNFPTSLVHLTLESGDLSSCSELSRLLPASLTSLWISEFDKLESDSKGLQHLTSLTDLSISKCPKMRNLPETLLPSLLSLNIFYCPKMRNLPEILLPSLLSLKIYGCPTLEERCSRSRSRRGSSHNINITACIKSSRRGSSYWPLISHIPEIRIDYKLI